ncbi:hypothetical protein BaRGS_00011294 [Batillaria attramentaria]|uniref:Uncharacterized protein n=1 Tax=Batillaria attramentaria TaxID=370345 RepID=A0ABD0LDQ9_9CAEN
MFLCNNTRKVLDGVSQITGFTKKSTQTDMTQTDNINYANDLNQFYSRFDCHTFSSEQAAMHDRLSAGTGETLGIEKEDVRRVLQHTNPHKAAGPDRVKP